MHTDNRDHSDADENKKNQPIALLIWSGGNRVAAALA